MGFMIDPFDTDSGIKGRVSGVTMLNTNIFETMNRLIKACKWWQVGVIDHRPPMYGGRYLTPAYYTK